MIWCENFIAPSHGVVRITDEAEVHIEEANRLETTWTVGVSFKDFPKSHSSRGRSRALGYATSSRFPLQEVACWTAKYCNGARWLSTSVGARLTALPAGAEWAQVRDAVVPHKVIVLLDIVQHIAEVSFTRHVVEGFRIIPEPCEGLFCDGCIDILQAIVNLLVDKWRTRATRAMSGGMELVNTQVLHLLQHIGFFDCRHGTTHAIIDDAVESR